MLVLTAMLLTLENIKAIYHGVKKVIWPILFRKKRLNCWLQINWKPYVMYYNLFLQSLVVGMFREGGRKDARMSLSLLLVSLRDSRLGSTSVAGKSALGLLLLFTSQCITFEGGAGVPWTVSMCNCMLLQNESMCKWSKLKTLGSTSVGPAAVCFSVHQFWRGGPRGGGDLKLYAVIKWEWNKILSKW